MLFVERHLHAEWVLLHSNHNSQDKHSEIDLQLLPISRSPPSSIMMAELSSINHSIVNQLHLRRRLHKGYPNQFVLRLNQQSHLFNFHQEDSCPMISLHRVHQLTIH